MLRKYDKFFTPFFNTKQWIRTYNRLYFYIFRMYLLIFKLIYPIRLLNYCFNTLWYPSVHFCKLVLYKILREKNGRIREKSILPATQALNEKSARANLNHFLQTSYDPIVVFTQFHSKALFPDEALAVNTSFFSCV